MVATVRREELDPDHPLHELVAGLRALELLAEVEVGRLSRQETAALAERLLRGPLEAADTDRLHAETEGNPLFVVEAIRAGWSGRDQPAPITPRVQAVIESRLAQLSGPARDLVGVAATIGREFTTDVLAQASQAGEEALVARPRRAVAAPPGPGPGARRLRLHPRPHPGGRLPGPQPRPAPPHPPAGGPGAGAASTPATRRRWPPSSPPTTSAPASPRRRWPGTSGRRRRPSGCRPTPRRSACWSAPSGWSRRRRRPRPAGSGSWPF